MTQRLAFLKLVKGRISCVGCRKIFLINSSYIRERAGKIFQSAVLKILNRVRIRVYVRFVCFSHARAGGNLITKMPHEGKIIYGRRATEKHHAFFISIEGIFH